MQIRLIGTGAIWTGYGSASAMVDDDIVIDLPGGSYKTMLRTGIDPDRIGHVLLTHLHGDHILDLPVWALSRVKFGEPEKAPRIYTEAVNAEPLKNLMEFSFGSSLRREVVDRCFSFVPDDEFAIGTRRIRRVRVLHSGIDAFGYVISDGRKTVSFTGDTGICGAVLEMAAESDLMVCDAALPEGNDKHMGVDNVRELAGRYPDCIFVTTHMTDEARAELEKEETDNLLAGFDGMVCFL